MPGKFSTVVASFCIALVATSAISKETINITLSTSLPANNPLSKAFEAYMAAVDEGLAGAQEYAVQWNYAHSGQIAAAGEGLDAVSSGLSDIGLVITPFHLDKLPIYALPYMTPFTAGEDPSVLAQVFEELEAEFPESLGWHDQNLVKIAGGANVDDYLLLTREQVSGLADLDGMRFMGAGANLLWLKDAGVAGVPASIGDYYNSLSTGLVDGVMIWPQMMGALKLCEPAPFALDADFGANSISHLAANADFVDRLPEPVRNAIMAAGPVWAAQSAEIAMREGQKGIEACQAQHDLKITRLDPSARAEMASSLPPLARDWADRVTSSNELPGHEILKVYMDKMRQAGQPVTRDWDVK